MAIVQWYKSQVLIGTQLFPVAPGGAMLNWSRNHSVPPIAGNYFLLNQIEGYQDPSIDVQIPLLDGSATYNGINPTNLNTWFMTRTSDYQNDVSAITSGIGFFDGYSGFTFANCKANSFSISGSKGDDVRFSANFHPYNTVPTVATSTLGSYTGFTGQPIRFQSLSFQHDIGAGLVNFDGILSFNIAYSNNISSDMEMTGVGPQIVFPIDVNANMPTCSAQFTFQANNTLVINDGDKIKVTVTQNALVTSFTLNNVVEDTSKNRNVGSGRQTRTYNCNVLGTSNTTGPLTVASS